MFTLTSNQQMHTNILCSILYEYSTIGFCCFCDSHQGGLQEQVTYIYIFIYNIHLFIFLENSLMMVAQVTETYR